VHALLHPPPFKLADQRVDEPSKAHEAQQQIINAAPIITILRITEALGIEVAQPNGKTYIKSYTTYPQTCNKERYSGYYANSTCSPN
jgi:hypothetical protein